MVQWLKCEGEQLEVLAEGLEEREEGLRLRMKAESGAGDQE